MTRNTCVHTHIHSRSLAKVEMHNLNPDAWEIRQETNEYTHTPGLWQKLKCIIFIQTREKKRWETCEYTHTSWIHMSDDYISVRAFVCLPACSIDSFSITQTCGFSFIIGSVVVCWNLQKVHSVQLRIREVTGIALKSQKLPGKFLTSLDLSACRVERELIPKLIDTFCSIKQLWDIHMESCTYLSPLDIVKVCGQSPHLTNF